MLHFLLQFYGFFQEALKEINLFKNVLQFNTALPSLGIDITFIVTILQYIVFDAKKKHYKMCMGLGKIKVKLFDNLEPII